MATERFFFIKTAVATIHILEDWLKKLALIISPLTFLNVSGTANPLVKKLALLISDLCPPMV